MMAGVKSGNEKVYDDASQPPIWLSLGSNAMQKKSHKGVSTPRRLSKGAVAALIVPLVGMSAAGVASACEKNAAGEARYVFFGLPADVEVAHYLTELIDGAVRAELGRYKVSADYKRFRHQERHLANASFTLGMCASIADRLVAMKAERDGVIQSSGRGLVVLKAAVVETELARLCLKLRTVEAGPGRFVSPDAYDAGGVAGGAVPLNPAIRRK